MAAISSNDVLEFKHIKHSADSILEYIDKRRKGDFRSLRTRWAKLNNLLEGGLTPGSSYVIGGASGSGKSSFLTLLETDLVEYNQDLHPYILSFTLEMSGSRIVGRKLSSKLDKSVQELYSGYAFLDGNALSDEDYQKTVEKCEEITKFPVYYVEKPGSVKEIKATIDKFREEISGDNWLIITLDHTLLVKGKSSESEREIINELQQMLLQEKKIGCTTVIQLTQLNRDIESVDRVMHANMHFPTRRDLSTSDQVYQCADVVLVIHRPETLGIQRFGINGWETKDMIYLFCIKNRDGEQKILKFKNDLKHNKITDIID